MTHSLLGTKENTYFVDARGIPAWHRLGTAQEMTISATAAFDKFTPIIITLEPMTIGFQGMEIPSENQAIMRWPMPMAGYEEPAQLGTVGPDYTLVEPRAFAEIMDHKIGKPIETIGVLDSGLLFVTMAMGGYEIGNDRINQYLLCSAPADGKKAYTVSVVNTRVVCSNTLHVALQGATQKYSVRHTADAEELLGAWMEYAWSDAENVGHDITEAFQAMGEKPITPSIADELFADIFQEPALPKFVPVPAKMEEREYAYEQGVKRTHAAREAAKAIFEGESFEASQGYKSDRWDTAWGAYNSASELIEFGGSRTKNRTERVMFGPDRKRMERAFTVCHNYSTS